MELLRLLCRVLFLFRFVFFYWWGRGHCIVVPTVIRKYSFFVLIKCLSLLAIQQKDILNDENMVSFIFPSTPLKNFSLFKSKSIISILDINFSKYKSSWHIKQNKLYFIDKSRSHEYLTINESILSMQIWYLL